MTEEELQKNSEHWYNLYKQTKKQLEEIKANADYQIEGRDLEIKTLGERCNQLLKDKGNLTDELDERTKDLLNANHKIGQLEQQIEKMKCCGNCKFKDCNKTSRYQTCWYCKNKDKWKLKE